MLLLDAVGVMCCDV